MSASPPTLNPFRAPEPPRFRKPWDPSSIVYFTLFGGLLAGAILFRINLRQLDLDRGGRLLFWVAVAYTLFSVAALSYQIVELEQGRAPLIEQKEGSHRALMERAALRRKTIEAVRKSNEARRRAGYKTEEGDDVGSWLDEFDEPPPFDADAVLEERRVEERLYVFLLWSVLSIGGALMARLLTGAQFRRYEWAVSDGVPLGQLLRPATMLLLGSWLVQFAAVVMGVMILTPR